MLYIWQLDKYKTLNGQGPTDQNIKKDNTNNSDSSWIIFILITVYLLVLYVFWLWFDKSYSLEIMRSWISYSLFIIIAIINPLFILVPHTGVYKQLSLLWKVLWKFFWMVLMVIIGLPIVETIWGIWTFVAVVNGKINNLVSSHKSWEVTKKLEAFTEKDWKDISEQCIQYWSTKKPELLEFGALLKNELDSIRIHSLNSVEIINNRLQDIILTNKLRYMKQQTYPSQYHSHPNEIHYITQVSM